MEVFDKYSVTPFSFREFGETNFDLPFSLGAPGDIRVDSVEGLLRSEYFSVWKKFLTSDSIERFEQAKFALVHHFRSGYVLGKEEEDSKKLLHTAFLCLRVVK